MSASTKPSTTICVLGAYGEFVGYPITKECLKREGVITKILVREGTDSDLKKKAKVDELVSLGASIVYGDAFDEEVGGSPRETHGPLP